MPNLSKALHSIPMFPGKVRLVHALGKVEVKRNGPTAYCSAPGGIILQVSLLDRIQREMWGGCYEPHVTACVAALLRAGDIFLDIGAHVGYHAALAAAIVGHSGAVHAFEPDPSLFASLRHNLRPFPWAVAHPYAVWEHNGILNFERSSFSQESGWGTLTTVRDLQRGEHLAVEAVSLDDWVRRAGIGRVSLIKIDAEGAEMSILQGARRFILSSRPAIVFEMNAVLLRYARTSPSELAELARGFGYCLWSLSRRRLKTFQLSTDSEFSDVLCLPEEQSQVQILALAKARFKLVSR